MAGKRTELLVDADTHSINIVQKAISLLKEDGQVVNTTIYAPKQRKQNKKWYHFVQKSDMGFRAVKREDGRSGEEVDAAIIRSVRDLWDVERVDCIALLTSDTGYLDIMQETLERGKQAIVLAEENCRASIDRYQKIGAKVLPVPREHQFPNKVRAVLHSNGGGSIEYVETDLAEFDQHKADALMDFLENLRFRIDSGYLIQSAAKFWFEHRLGDLTVFPQTIALDAVHDVMQSRSRQSIFRKYNSDLASGVPTGSVFLVMIFNP